jgi:hypothetical protein
MPVIFRVRHLAQQSLFVTILAVAFLAAMASPAKAHYGETSWDCLAHYESSHRWHVNTGNGYYGGLQFSLSTWAYYGGPNYSGERYPNLATRSEQIVIAKRTAWKGWLQHAPQGGSSAWPNTWWRCN